MTSTPRPTKVLTSERRSRLLSVIDTIQPDLSVIMENIHDPHNVAAIMRSCDAVGARDMHLVYTIEKYPSFSSTGKKSSAGTRKWVRRHRHASIGECHGRLRALGFTILVSTLSEDAVSLHDINLTRPVAILFGNEHLGASPEAIAGADIRFTIPMMGMAQSLNVSVAAAVTLYEALRQRKAAGLYDKPRLPRALRDALYQEWSNR
jgi:tRNA (guanosine-2'-O-)-methyltransferase